MLRIFHYVLLLFIALLPRLSFAQATIQGSVVDKSINDILPGARVELVGANTGTVTDIYGNYSIENLKPGKYTVACSYISFKSDSIEVVVKAGEVVRADFNLLFDNKTLETVVITAKQSRASAGSLIALTQKTPSMISGMVQDDIRRTPDRSTKDVLKRISSTSIQENKFVIVRGLADRYNLPMVNGLQVPSTETDRRAFSFDLLPSALIDNIIIYKTASPDLPGEFAGGIIQVNTKEVPESDFFQIGLGSGYNTVTTGKAYRFHEKGKTDWLGLDNGLRALPEDIVDTKTYQANYNNQSKRFAQSKQFSNNWAISDYEAMPVPINLQLSGAKRIKLESGVDFSVIGALTYFKTPSITQTQRADYSGTETLNQEFAYQDDEYSFSTLWGGLVNMALDVNPTNRIIFNQMFNVNSLDRYTERNGKQFLQLRNETATSDYFNSNRLYSGQVRGEHRRTRLSYNWDLALNSINRNTPDYRQMFYYNNFEDSTGQYLPAVSLNTPSPNYGGRTYMQQKETMTVGGAQVVYAAGSNGKTSTTKTLLKAGVNAIYSKRDFSNRWFGYVRPSTNFDFELLDLPLSEIFDTANLRPKGLSVREGTRSTDSYDANALTLAAYVSGETTIFRKLHVSGGVRLENYNQAVNTFESGTENPLAIDTNQLNILPSINLAYSINEKHRIRAALSRTVSRPNFREIAPFVFWDFNLQAGIYGEPALVATNITNADLRYEFFPTGNQMIALTGFYKQFTNPIEQYVDIQAERRYGFLNADGATSVGFEAEYRIAPISALTFFGNVSYIDSKIDFSRTQQGTGLKDDRPMQGQSPYVLNFGLTANAFQKKASFTLLYNQIGRRIWLVGIDNYPDIYEAPRPVVDATLTIKVSKAIELKFTAADLIARDFVFYQDNDKSGKYESDKDAFVRKTKVGSTFGMNLNVRF